MRNKKVLFAVQAAMIAALYVVLTYITNLLGLASGTIQVRFSEALCILPVFTPAAIPGLFIGCLISNLITGGIIWDIIFGSIATLLGALGTYFLRKRSLYTRFHLSSPTLLSCHSCSDTDMVLQLYTRVLISLFFSMQLQSESVRLSQSVYLEAC